ncbi:MAG: hypothetical protein ACLVB5_06845 [Christensenellales bacterium]
MQNGNAIAEKIGEEAMPDVSWLDVGQSSTRLRGRKAPRPGRQRKADDSLLD